MTTHDRDKVIAAAKEARIDIDGINQSLPLYVATQEEMSRFYAIAHEAGRASRDAEIATLREQVKVLRDLIPKRVPDGFVSFGKYYAEQESIFNPSYHEMTKFKNRYLCNCEEALAATEPKE